MDSLILIKKEDIYPFYKSEYFFERMFRKYSYIFPINRSRKLAGLVADLMGDGHIQKHTSWRLDYTSKSKQELLRFEKELCSLFGIKGKIRPCTTNKYSKTFNYGVNVKPVALALHLCGAPKGAKVFQKFDIPSWILEDKEYFRAFIHRLFCCEGNVDYQKPAIELRMHKEKSIVSDGIKFFNKIKKYLKFYFDIITTNVFTGRSFSRKDGRETVEVRLKICRKEPVNKFVKEIDFPPQTSNKKRIFSILNGNL